MSDTHLAALKILLDRKGYPRSDFEGTQGEITRRLRELREDRFGAWPVAYTAKRGYYLVDDRAHPNEQVQRRRHYIEEQARL